MIKQIAWNTFKNTGDINTFMELQEVKEAEKKIEQIEVKNGLENKVGDSHIGNNQNKGDYPFRK